ncbi:uncharacterized protein J4E78_001665 [Alternaria triticimaculans]|uniref:uncharacterized protein n=1 Tax=Alternaria triticimaculans TaxID=297637 RepID=UPI0020C3D20C|nr:uncharacterized protein J4E78_001665 [Alternaria triticimaculans]KAI4673158.1 hypothetical protein J4E78_001665 [Alternaria triticimaculans]
MATSATTSTPGPLPPTLFSIYRTYKRETSIVIRWLNAFDQSAEFSSPPSSGDHDNSEPQEMTVRQIAERARKAASTGKRPPKNIESAFKMVIMNRSRLTKHYETLPSSTQGVQDSTERHRVFNETLAEAYALLFPKTKERSNKSMKRTSCDKSDASLLATNNSFEVLTGLIEAEKDFDYSASEYWRKNVPEPEPERFTITEDPIEDMIAFQVYFAELQAIVEAVKTIWKSHAAGDLSLAAAGWLTNLAQHFSRRLRCHARKARPCDEFSLWKAGLEGGCELRPSVTADELASMDFFRTATISSFSELSHGGGLIWPSTLLVTFIDTQQLPESPGKERRPFQAFFRNSMEERTTKESFVHAITNLLSVEGCQVSEEKRRAESVKICADRYSHDVALLAFMIKSASQHPASAAHQPNSPATYRHDMYEDHLQHPSVLPLIADIKDKKLSIPTIITAHMLLESGRSFLHEYEKTGKKPPNCRIIALSRANEVLGATEQFYQSYAQSSVKLYHDDTAAIVWMLREKMVKFTSDKTFDLYSQSPWVMGSYMSAISDITLFVGLQILNEQEIFGATMHLYNMLRQIGGCPEIPILEHLRTLFKDVVFAGKQYPKRNFCNIFELFCGAKIFKQTITPRTMLMAAPRKEPRHAACASQRISMDTMGSSAWDSLISLYAPSPELWVKLTGDPKMDRKIHRGLNYNDIFLSFPPSELIRRAQNVIQPEYKGTFPIARVNCFAVLDLCTKIMLEVAARFEEAGYAVWPPQLHDTPELVEVIGSLDVSIPSAMACVRLAMYDVVARTPADGKQWDYNIRDKPSVVTMREVIMKACEGKKVEDFLWKNV